MGTVKLRNINPLGHVDVRLLGREGGPDNVDRDEEGVGCLVPGEVFEVDEDVAGFAPHWRYADEDDVDPDTGQIYRWLEQRTQVVDDDGAPLVEVFDPGVGLLAQVGNYELAEANDGLDKLTIPELKKKAEDLGIDLGGATKKPDILAAIRKA